MENIPHFNPYLFSFVLVIFSTAYFVLDLQEVKQSELRYVLTEAQAEDLWPFLQASGIWSPELLVAVGIHTLPQQLLMDKAVRHALQDVKYWCRERLMLQLWLRDLEHNQFVPLIQHYPLSQWGYTYPHSNSYRSYIDHPLDTAHRHILKTQRDQFLQAISEFRQRSTFAMVKIRQYEMEIQDMSKHHLPHNIWRFLCDKNLYHLLNTLLLGLGYSIIGYAIVTLGLLTKASKTNTIAWAVVCFWVHPPTGRLCFQTMAVFRSFCFDPTSGLVFIILAEIWMTTNEIVLLHLGLAVSLVLTILFSLSWRVIRFQPIVNEDREGNIFVTITGIGNIDNSLEAFIQSPQSTFVSRFLIGQPHYPTIALPEVTGISIEDVDTGGDLILKLISPSLHNNKLKHLSIVNNSCFSDEDAKFLAGLCEENTSLEVLRVCYQEGGWLWHNAQKLLNIRGQQGKMSHTGVEHILSSFLGSHHKQEISMLDFTGIELTKETVSIASKLKGKISSISVLGSLKKEIGSDENGTNIDASFREFLWTKGPVLAVIAWFIMSSWNMLQHPYSV